MTVANTSLNQLKKKILQHKLRLNIAFCFSELTMWLLLVRITATLVKDFHVLYLEVLKWILVDKILISPEGKDNFLDVRSGHTSALNRFVLTWPCWPAQV